MPSTSASFDGLNIFGDWCQMRTANNPRARQVNAYGGLSGVESLDQGGRGKVTTAVGRHVGAPGSGMTGLATLQEQARAYDNEGAYVLVDTRGVTWLFVQMVSFEPEGQIKYAGNGSYSQRYTMRFHHLL